MDTTIDDWDATTAAVRYSVGDGARRSGLFFYGSLPRGRRREDRADLHLGGHAGRRGPRDHDVRRPRRRVDSPARASRCATASRTATSGCESGMEVGVSEGYATLDGCSPMALSELLRADPARRHRRSPTTSPEAGRHGGLVGGGTGVRMDGSGRGRRTWSSGSGFRVRWWHHACHAVASPSDDPAAAWATHPRPCRSCSTIPRWRHEFHPSDGSMHARHAIDQFYTSDVFLHTWDLAKASGQSTRSTLTSAEPCFPAWNRSTRACAPPGSTDRRCRAGRAHARTRLIAFVGRDPAWWPASVRERGPCLSVTPPSAASAGRLLPGAVDPQ